MQNKSSKGWEFVWENPCRWWHYEKNDLFDFLAQKYIAYEEQPELLQAAKLAAEE